MKNISVAVVFALLAGCSGSDATSPGAVEDSTSADTVVEDTFVPDTALPKTDSAMAVDTATDDTRDVVDAVDAADTADTLAADTADTFVADTADTFVADTADTFVADTADTAVADTAVSDTAMDSAPTDVATDTADAGDAGAALPGATCVGTLTDTALVNLYATKPVTGTPTYILGGSTTARRLGSYTSTMYSRSCASTTGCGPWAAAMQPAYETFYSINSGVRAGSVYLWSPSSGAHKIGIVSTTVASDCKGWTQGIGTLIRSGETASVTLAASVEDDCSAGADPVFYFQEIDLYDPTGIVTDHCMKLTYSKQRNRVDVGPGAFTYDEYMIVYDATY